MIEVKNLKISFGKLNVLKDVSIKIEKGEKGVFGYLKNGSVMYFRRAANGTTWSGMGIFVCMNEKACKNINEDGLGSTLYTEVDGRNVFRLTSVGLHSGQIPKSMYHENLINGCKNKTNANACLMLIVEAGWRIPDDYPIKF